MSENSGQIDAPAEKGPPGGFRSGFVAVLGLPNVGKSTLVNGLVGRKISGVSAKPQTTRRSVMGVRTEENCQMIFIDTPGLAESESRLGAFMFQSAGASAKEADIIIYVLDARRPQDIEAMGRFLKGRRAPIIAAINKIDLVDRRNLLPQIARLHGTGGISEIVPISALKSDGTDVLLGIVRERLPEGPKWYENDSDADPAYIERIAQEIVQEKLFSRLHQEIPYSSGVQIESVEEAENGILRIGAVILVERKSHKPIVIGEKGSMLKTVGTQARYELEKILGRKVFLGLWVKVEEDWRNREAVLADMGYTRSGKG